MSKRNKKEKFKNYLIYISNFIGTGNNSSNFIIQTKNEDLLSTNENENLIKNSLYYRNSAGALKEFYILLFRGIESRLKSLIIENDELKDCIKSLINELMNIVEFKMKTCVKNLKWHTFDFNDRYKYNQEINNILNNLNFDYSSQNINNVNNGCLDQTHDYKIENNKNNEFINEEQILGSFRNNKFSLEKTQLNKLLEINKEDFTSKLNILLKTFREIYLYDVIKVSPEDEFLYTYCENAKQSEIIDNKPNLVDMPFYKGIFEFFENFKKGNFIELIKNFENTLKDFTKFTQDINEISTPRDILQSHKSNIPNEEFIFNNQGSLSSNSFKNNNFMNKNNDTIKITLRDTEFERKFNSNSNKERQFSDFNSENFNINFILPKLEDKIHKINCDIRLKIEEIEQKLLEFDKI